MARGPYAKTSEQRQAILAVARDVFGELGFRAASIREIANRLGMTDAGVRYHFAGKEALLIEVVKQKEAEDADCTSDLYLRDLVRHNQSRPESVRLFTTLSGEATDPGHPAHDHFVERYARIRARLADRLAASQGAGPSSEAIDPEVAARLTLAVMDGLQIQWLLDPDLDVEIAFNDFVERYFAPDQVRTSETARREH